MIERARKSAATAQTQKKGVTDTLLQSIVGYRLKRAYMRIHDDYQAHLDEIGFNQRDLSALALIVENPDMSQSDLARALSIERPNVVVIVDGLERQEFITRNKVPNDRRTYALRSTLRGRRALDKAFVAIQAHEDRLMKELTDQERETLRDLLGRIGSP